MYEQKYESLTIQNAYVLSKVMLNGRISRKLMEKLTGDKIYRVSVEKELFGKCGEDCDGIAMKMHMANPEQSVFNVELYVADRDLFGKGKAIYRFAEQCREVPGLRLQESLQRIFICATAETIASVKDEELKAFLYYVLNSEDKRSNLVKMLDDEVRRVKRNSVYAKEYRRLQCAETEVRQREYAQLQQGRKPYKR